jgi:hypothetical protein
LVVEDKLPLEDADARRRGCGGRSQARRSASRGWKPEKGRLEPELAADACKEQRINDGHEQHMAKACRMGKEEKRMCASPGVFWRSGRARGCWKTVIMRTSTPLQVFAARRRRGSERGGVELARGRGTEGEPAD